VLFIHHQYLHHCWRRPSAGGAPTLAVVADASDVECETPRGDAATDAAAKTAWPGAEADGDEDEEDEEEDGDAFGEDESGLGEMHGNPLPLLQQHLNCSSRLCLACALHCALRAMMLLS